MFQCSQLPPPVQGQIADMSADEFQRHKDALAAQKLEKPKRLYAQSMRYFSEISTQTYHFGRAEAECVILRTVTQPELVAYYAEHIRRSGAARNTMAVHILSTAEGGVAHPATVAEPAAEDGAVAAAAVASSGGHRRIGDLAAFKASKGLYPLAQPFIDIQPKGARSKL